MQAGPRQVRQRWRQGVEAVVERQQRVATGHHRSLLLKLQNRRVDLFRPPGRVTSVLRLRHFCTVVGLMP